MIAAHIPCTLLDTKTTIALEKSRDLLVTKRLDRLTMINKKLNKISTVMLQSVCFKVEVDEVALLSKLRGLG